MKIGDRVEWAGVQNPFCAPGRLGTVKKISYKDPDSICVTWDEGEHFGYQAKERYTWERRSNLVLTTDDGKAGVLVEA